MAALEQILSQAVLLKDAIRDRVTGNADKVLARGDRGGTVQITVVGDFSEPWANDAEEIDAIRAGDEWSPSTNDFIAFAKKSRAAAKGRVPIVGSTEAFIHLILSQKPKSIARINIITHGSSGTISFKGEVVSGNVMFDDELDLAVLRDFLENGIIFNSQTVQWSEVENRFADNAVLVIYGCTVGMSASFIQDVADMFDVRVQAFTHELRYQFSEQALSDGKIKRQLATVDGENDFLDLVPEIDKKPSLKNPFK